MLCPAHRFVLLQRIIYWIKTMDLSRAWPTHLDPLTPGPIDNEWNWDGPSRSMPRFGISFHFLIFRISLACEDSLLLASVTTLYPLFTCFNVSLFPKTYNISFLFDIYSSVFLISMPELHFYCVYFNISSLYKTNWKHTSGQDFKLLNINFTIQIFIATINTVITLNNVFMTTYRLMNFSRKLNVKRFWDEVCSLLCS